MFGEISTPFMMASKNRWYGGGMEKSCHGQRIQKPMRGGSTDMGQMPESTTNNKPLMMRFILVMPHIVVYQTKINIQKILIQN